MPDVFETFAHRVDADPPGRRASLPSVRTLARSAGATVAVMLLGGVGAGLGGWAAWRNQPDLLYADVFWEGLVLLLWCTVWAVFAGATTVAVTVLAVGVPWARRQRAQAGRDTSTSAP